MLAAAAAVTSTYLLKHYLIMKPDLGVQEALSNSAPSGHTTFAAAAGAALFLAAPRFLRPTVALCAALATCLTGASTIINGWHRPADVVTAILVTAIWTVVLCASGRFCGAGAWWFGVGAVDDDCDAVPVVLRGHPVSDCDFCADSRWCVYRGDLHDHCGELWYDGVDGEPVASA